MDAQNCLDEVPQMLPPDPGSFVDREELIQYVGDFAVTQGYVVTIKQSKKDKVVVLGCDRGGVYRNRRKQTDEVSADNTRKRKTSSRLTNCPFEAVGKKDDGLWLLSVKNGSHNHEPIRNLSEHPSARRFSETEVLLIKEMTDAGLKPRQILKRLRQSNPELASTRKDVYNVKAKIRQGNTTVRNFKSLRPQTTSIRNSFEPVSEPCSRLRYPLRVNNLIGGKLIDSQSFASVDVINPATQEVVSQVPLTTDEEFRAAVFAAKRAFQPWRSTPVTARQRIMFKFEELIRRDIDKLALSITVEHGKTLKDAYDEVLRGLEIVEHACGLAIMQMGEFTPNASRGVDSYSIREPLGVCAGICSFEFPAMSPLWMFSTAVMCGNTFILKPSEKVPGVSVILAELAMDAGFPSGVLNVVNGTYDIINGICDHEDIKAISFIGPETAGAYVHARASANRKRVQSNVGNKNYSVVMPDARIDSTLNAIAAAGFGGAGQKCTTLNTVIFVGASSIWEDKLLEHAKAIKVTAGTEIDAELGPVVSKQVKDRICGLIQSSVENGARVLLDGRDIMVAEYEQGNFIGPTILSDVTMNMDCFKDDISGPVLLCMQVGSIDDAINIINTNKFGCGASIFTSSSLMARKFQSDIEVAQRFSNDNGAGFTFADVASYLGDGPDKMTKRKCVWELKFAIGFVGIDFSKVGINVLVSDPVPFTSFMGCKPCFAADINLDGKSGGISFYTQIKKVTQQWNDIQQHIGVGANYGGGFF